MKTRNLGKEIKPRPKVLWKAVTKGARWSAVVDSAGWRRRYPKGGNVHARRGTIGLLCFRTDAAARRFLQSGWILMYDILRVAPLGPCRPVELVACECYSHAALSAWSALEEHNERDLDSIYAPEDTVAVQSVRVLT